MEYKNYQKSIKRGFAKNKKIFYFFLLIGLVILIVVAVSLFFLRAQEQKKLGEKLEVEKQKIEQTLEQKRRNATYARFTFFLASPPGERGGMNMPSYQEGSWRITDTLNKDKKMTILYIKNSESGVPLMYIRYGYRNTFKFESGEKELKTNSPKLVYVYYFYPADAYLGPNHEDFVIVQEDFENGLETFRTF
jgi:hypothetical protein